MISTRNLDPNKIKIDDKSDKNTLIYDVGYARVKNLKYIKINSINSLYLIINKRNGYIEENHGNKYLTLVPTDKSKYILEKYEELWTKIRHLIRSKANNSDDYDEKYMKIKFDSNDHLPLKKLLEFHNMIIFVRFVFHDDNKCYLQVFLDECLYKL